jgi:hypothetical protein
MICFSSSLMKMSTASGASVTEGWLPGAPFCRAGRRRWPAPAWQRQGETQARKQNGGGQRCIKDPV